MTSRDETFENQEAKPELVAEVEPEPVAEVEPELGAEVEPEPGAEVEPEPGAEAKPTPAKSGQDVEVSSLQTLELFRYQGRIYSKRRASSGGVRGLSQKGDKLITLPPDTIVKTV